MKHADALKIAEELVECLRPVCTRIEIAGSIRRGKADVKDIEIVAIPDLTPVPRPRAEFGKPIPKMFKTKLDAILEELFQENKLQREKDGEKYKKLIIDPQEFGVDGEPWGGSTTLIHPVKVDLFLVTPPAEWGVQMVIRTGPAEFSHWCVTRVRNGGAMKNTHRVQDGAVWLGDREEKNPDPSTKLSMPEEIDFLNFLGLGWIEPGEREARWTR
ncbi:MAG: hypothetical protein C4583_04265 [Anaerolineaceae bacterium]|nr:MAG: hypothetical protein C4583_04265 [Anaerolineaceae bacterium]